MMAIVAVILFLIALILDIFTDSAWTGTLVIAGLLFVALHLSGLFTRLRV